MFDHFSIFGARLSCSLIFQYDNTTESVLKWLPFTTPLRIVSCSVLSILGLIVERKRDDDDDSYSDDIDNFSLVKEEVYMNYVAGRWWMRKLHHMKRIAGVSRTEISRYCFLFSCISFYHTQFSAPFEEFSEQRFCSPFFDLLSRTHNHWRECKATYIRRKWK